MKVIVFLILSLPLLALSWRALFSLKNHGLYRLVVFECILWLAIQNYRHLIVEEKENMAYFGERYRRYMLKTKMFIPRVI
jgi:protein-S-isoprenylcysteine O-methyltransferase Ste14